MAILNLTQDSFWEPSRFNIAVLDSDADIVDIGAVSTRPGAADVPVEEEWRRLQPCLESMPSRLLSDSHHWEDIRISIDTTRSEIVRRAYNLIGPFIVNDISAGNEDPDMLRISGALGLPVIAMHSRGNPRTMDSLTSYKGGFLASMMDYFKDFERRALDAGVGEWIIDPGFGFAKTIRQNIYLLDHLDHFSSFGRPILVGLADKRFTRFPHALPGAPNRTEAYHLRALAHGADILRVHDVCAARSTVGAYLSESIVPGGK